ncbi:MAG: hypothetical protein KKC73_04940 [Proteobacteria bacterium]|nr:hypothetical protein [Pseudomonadota bacterium]
MRFEFRININPQITQITQIFLPVRVRKQTIVRKVEIGIPTLNDILDELAKPGRDPREKFEVFAFADGMADKFVKNPADIVKVQQKVMAQKSTHSPQTP